MSMCVFNGDTRRQSQGLQNLGDSSNKTHSGLQLRQAKAEETLQK
jgi:hypothetical protein